jgi:hypothetical protein
VLDLSALKNIGNHKLKKEKEVTNVFDYKGFLIERILSRRNTVMEKDFFFQAVR